MVLWQPILRSVFTSILVELQIRVRQMHRQATDLNAFITKLHGDCCLLQDCQWCKTITAALQFRSWDRVIVCCILSCGSEQCSCKTQSARGRQAVIVRLLHQNEALAVM